MQQKNQYLRNAKFNITQEQIDKIRPYFNNVDDYLDDLSKFQDELNDAIIMELDENYEDTNASIILQRVYDEIYNQN